MLLRAGGWNPFVVLIKKQILFSLLTPFISPYNFPFCGIKYKLKNGDHLKIIINDDTFEELVKIYANFNLYEIKRKKII